MEADHFTFDRNYHKKLVNSQQQQQQQPSSKSSSSSSSSKKEITNPEELLEQAVLLSASLHPSSQSDQKLKKVRTSLISWVNGILHAAHHNQLFVRDLSADLADGVILCAFIEELTG